MPWKIATYDLCDFLPFMYFILVIKRLSFLLCKVLPSACLSNSKSSRYCLRKILLNNNDDKNLYHYLFCARTVLSFLL